MTNYHDAERIRQRMALLRGRIDRDVGRWTADAGRWFEWRHYVENYPVATLSAAALAAYWLMPHRHRPQSVTLDPSTIEELVRRGGIHVDAAPAPRVPQQSWADAGVSLLGSMLIRGAVAYLGQYAGREVGEEVAEAQEVGLR